MRPVVVSVGSDQGDIRGADNRALQAAVDYVASFGGGQVCVLPGRYTMTNSLHLRSRVQVIGSGADTVLVKAAAVSARLYLDGDYGEEQVTPEDADGFEPGMGITIGDDHNHGFHVTVANILAKDGNTLAIDKPLNGDYMVAHNAVAATTFPVISGYHIADATVQGLTVEGNRDANPPLNGCRGAGIFLYRAERCAVRECTVRGFNGDGISFQQSGDTLVERCECAHNAALGLHPGSGSQRPTVLDCWSHDNGTIGLFLCWRVRHGRFEGNRLENNGHTGISIGHKDSDNYFRANVCSGNGRYGLLFRDETEPMAGHRNTFEDCRFVDNGGVEEGAGVHIGGATDGTTFRRCLFGNSGPAADGRQRYGISIGATAGRIILEEVAFASNRVQDIRDDRSGGA
ncbi:MAG: right-handed parallel beta-helix repeat-containing protein [Anaerolineae bacterium]